MKCPYTVNIEQVVQYYFERDDSGNVVNEEQKLIEQKIYVLCLKEECGAFYNGRCHYNQISND